MWVRPSFFQSPFQIGCSQKIYHVSCSKGTGNGSDTRRIASRYDRNLHTVRVVFMPYSFFQSDPPCDHGIMIRDIFKRQYFGWWLVCSRVASTSVSLEFGRLPYDLVCIQCFGCRFFISRLPFQFGVFQQLSVMGAFFISALFLVDL